MSAFEWFPGIEFLCLEKENEAFNINTQLCPCRNAANAKKVPQTCDQASEHCQLAKCDLESVIAKLLSGVAPNLIWVTQRNKVDWKRLRKDQVTNCPAMIARLLSQIVILRWRINFPTLILQQKLEFTAVCKIYIGSQTFP